MNRVIAIAAGLLGAWCAPAGPASPQSFSVSGWPSERVELLDGQRYEGLIESQDDAWVNLIQISRRHGRPMHLVIRPIERSKLAAVVRLPAAERAKLRQRIEKFLNRSRIEAGRMDAVRLDVVERQGKPLLRYQGKWFSLESSIEEATTRRVIVRVEQIFTAFRQILPPRTQRRRPLRLVVLGSMSQYHAHLKRLGLEIRNPACFVEDDNLVVAGSELSQFAAELAKINTYHDQLRWELEQLEKRLPARLAEVAKQLAAQGASKDQIKKLLAAERGQFERQIKRKRDELKRVDRNNARKFDVVTRRMFARLYHEAFHAYLENYVYPHQDFDVPPWLNEGLAVMFEAGLLEGDTLRFDLPQCAALRQLKADLKSPQPLPLEKLLCAEQRAFVLTADNSATAEQYYAHAWGLVYGLTFNNHLLDASTLDRYVRSSGENAAPVERFERLVGMPLGDFQQRWREYIMKLH